MGIFTVTKDFSQHQTTQMLVFSMRLNCLLRWFPLIIFSDVVLTPSGKTQKQTFKNVFKNSVINWLHIINVRLM